MTTLSSIKKLEESGFKGIMLIDPSFTVPKLIPTERALTLKKMQFLVGGYIEVVRVRINEKMYDMICNEEGLLEGLPFNPIASHLYQNTYDSADLGIVGNAFIPIGWELK